MLQGIKTLISNINEKDLFFFLYQHKEVTLRPWRWGCLAWYRFWNCSAIPHFLISRRLRENFDKLASLSSDLPRGAKGGKTHESRMISWIKYYIVKKTPQCGFLFKACLNWYHPNLVFLIVFNTTVMHQNVYNSLLFNSRCILVAVFFIC